MTGGVGTVAALWRYPAASMCGETIESVDIDTGGVVGDRGWGFYAIGDATAGFAARGRKWRNLVQARARFIEPPRRANLGVYGDVVVAGCDIERRCRDGHLMFGSTDSGKPAKG